jgi:RNA polymerase sigma-70 factor (ECF subfamily)
VSETPSDEDLMTAYQAGDAAAFEELYSRHRSPLYRFILRQTGNASLAEELYQDVWMNIIRTREKYRPIAAFRTYLFQVARNRVIDHFRSNARSPLIAMTVETGDIQDPTPLNPETRLDEQRRADHLREQVGALPAEQREAFLLHHEAGLSLAEIALITDTGVETVKSRLRYAMAKLRNAMEGLL